MKNKQKSKQTEKQNFLKRRNYAQLNFRMIGTTWHKFWHCHCPFLLRKNNLKLSIRSIKCFGDSRFQCPFRETDLISFFYSPSYVLNELHNLLLPYFYYFIITTSRNSICCSGNTNTSSISSSRYDCALKQVSKKWKTKSYKTQVFVYYLFSYLYSIFLYLW